MAKPITLEVPTIKLPDGRLFLSDMAIAELGLQDFVDRFSNYWQRDDLLCGYIGAERASDVRR